MRILFMLASFLALSILATLYFNSSFIWIALLFLITSGYIVIISRNTGIRIVLINLGAIVFAFGVIEAYFWVNEHSNNNSKYRESYSAEYYVTHDILGYGPIKNQSVDVTKYYDNELIYAVSYRIDKHGLRISPPSDKNAEQCVLFFGGSVTFGEGVSDDKTMPYSVGVKTRGIYRIYNFGFHGYGPHQMLAAVEHGMVEQVINCKPKYVIYQAIAAHIARTAGLASWDKHGPRYQLMSNGVVTYTGHFDDPGNKRNRFERLLDKSFIYQYTLGIKRSTFTHDIELFLGVIDKAKKIFHDRYPNSEFHVLLWGYSGNNDYQKILTGMQAKAIDVHLVSHILPHYEEKPVSYEISPHDAHPNVVAHNIIANYIAKEILK